MSVRRSVAIALAILAAALIVYGMIQPVAAETRWILALWMAAPLLFGASRLLLPSRPHGLARSVQNIGLIVALGFVLLSLQLLRQQAIRADDIASFIYIDETTGQTTSNVRGVLEALKTKRGKIFDRNGSVLADSQIVDKGYTVRTYPITDQYDPAAFSNILGFFSHRYGEAGLEATYGDYLNGERDVLRRVQDGLLGRQHVGDDLRLTIDARIQAAAYEALAGRPGSVVVLDPKTGAVLAMVSYPGFDPRGLAFNPVAPRDAENKRIDDYWHQLNSEGSIQPLINRPTQARYPPGSIYKTVTAVGALEHPREGQPDQIDCPNERETEAGAPPVVNAVNNLAERTGNPSNLEKVFAFSCNTAFAEYSMRLGADLMTQTAASFDIYEPGKAPDLYGGFTDLPTVPSVLYVQPGFLNRRPALADTGYGQGQLLVTPLEMAMVAATVANDGVMMQPYLVEKVTRPNGELVISQGQHTIRRVMSSNTAQIMRTDMRAVIEYGFGQAAGNVPGVRVGGKSGTAEYPCPTPDNPNLVCTHAWFIAIAPLEESQIAIAVMLEGGGEGSGAGAQLAADVIRGALEP
ncbi:MAG: penicillin-binding protein 2 [Roseiflexaceae bacterium]|nr:penicillin-binding protein 2 [Roseiflexaceae bacterium]